MDSILSGLNKEQIEAVTHKDGPLLIIAGAGTGKTSVITRRIAWLVSESLAKPEEILALTFTDKAAMQMQDRVDILMPYGYTDTWISTFHAFGDKLLRENALVAGLNPDFKVLTQPEVAVFLREHIFEFNLSYFRPLSDPTRFIEAMISLFSRARDEDISVNEYLKFAQSLAERSEFDQQDPAMREELKQQLELAAAYEKYTQLLANEGLLDFGNQFYLALQLLRNHPLILSKYQKQFKYILVDEFQDTNLSQFQIVRLLSGVHKNITVVADDDQCIYRWRGAAYSNVLNFMREYPDAAKIALIQNYRSAQEILDSAYKLIQNNNPERFEVKASINKRLVASEGKNGFVKHLHFDTNSSEADHVARIIREKVSQGNIRYRDCAILVRSNSDAQAFLQALNIQDIPWQFSGSQGLYSREEVRLCLNFLRIIANPSDSMSLYYLSGSDIYAIDLKELSVCAHYAKRRNMALYRVFSELNNIEDLSYLSAETKEKIDHILSDIDKFLKLSRHETTGRLLYAFLTDTGYLKSLTCEPDLAKETKIQNIAKFFNIVRDFELVAKVDRVISFVNYLNLLIEAGDDPSTVEADPDLDAVNVLTIHKAKGLEFEIVFMVGVVQGKFPVPRRSQTLELPESLIKEELPSGDYHLQEERRLFYVGMTRAKSELYLTSADDYGTKKLRKVSQFVSEAFGKEAIRPEAKKTSALESIQRFALNKGFARSVEPVIDADKIINLSYYQIDDYLTCPLKYKYVNILRVPIMEHHTVIYGRAMHEAVSRYFQASFSDKAMDLGGLIEVFRLSFDPQGFLDEKHQRERLRVGEAALAKFYKDEQLRVNKPIFIEKDFSFIIDNNRINGRFDLIEKDGDSVFIMDFKTSEIKYQKDADKRVKDSLQLKLYALAYKAIFNELPAGVKLYFLESGIVGVLKISEKHLEEAKEKITEVSRGIRGHIFSANPTYMACSYCAYNQICPSAVLR